MRVHNSILKHSAITLVMCFLVLTLFGCGRENGNYNQVTAVGRVSSQTGTGISSEHKLLDGREQYTIHVPDGEELDPEMMGILVKKFQKVFKKHKSSNKERVDKLKVGNNFNTKGAKPQLQDQ